MGSRDFAKGVGIVVDNQLEMSSPCGAVAKRVNVVPGCVKRGNLTSEQGGDLGLLCPVLGPAVPEGG